MSDVYTTTHNIYIYIYITTRQGTVSPATHNIAPQKTLIQHVFMYWVHRAKQRTLMQWCTDVQYSILLLAIEDFFYSIHSMHSKSELQPNRTTGNCCNGDCNMKLYYIE